MLCNTIVTGVELIFWCLLYLNLREQTLQVHGCKLFNEMPAGIRNLEYCGVEDFKIKLDQFLSQIPDQPEFGSLLPTTCDPITMKPSTSILDWASTLGNDLRRNPRGG